MASPIGHGLAGAALAVAIEGPWRGGAWRRLLPAVLLANLMDADFLLGLALGRRLHHGHIHSLGFAVAAAAVLALVAGRGALGRGRVLLWSLAMLSSHVAVDYLTADTSPPHGLMVFWPLSSAYLNAPYPIFPDVWRGSLGLVFGWHNLLVALRELWLGAGLAALVLLARGLPRRVPAALALAAAVLGMLEAAVHAPLAKAAERQMAAFLGPIEPGLAPPAQRSLGILFSRSSPQGSDLFLIQPDGTGLRQVTTTPGNEEMGVRSPDGSRLAYSGGPPDTSDIWVARADGTEPVRLTSDPAEDESPTWSADGRRIAFGSNRGGRFALHVVSVEGHDLGPIGPASGRTDLLAASSPDGEWLVFTSRSGILPLWTIRRMRWDGRDETAISPQPGCRAKWSPDGRWLAYVSEGTDGTSDIWVFQADGRGLRRVTRTPEYDYDPCWSPDGRELCFARGRHGKSGWDLWIVGVNGENLRPLTRQGAGDRFPEWR